MKNFLFLLSILSFLSNAQTNLSGGVYNSETWDLAGSPYNVSGNLVIFDGVEVTIEAGVKVMFEPSASMELRGKLLAIGTASDSIVFTSSLSSPTIGAWDGIKVIGTDPAGSGNQVSMQYVKGMYASTFIDLDFAYQGPYNFTNCCFAFNGKVNEDGGSPSTNFDYCIFEFNNQALDWCQFDSRVSNSNFYNNVIGLIGIAKVETCYFSGHSNFAMNPYGITTGCTIENNNIGVKTGFNSENHTFTNNTVMNNDVGVKLTSFFNGTQTFTGNRICDNTTYNLQLLSQNNADLGMNCWCSTDESQIQTGIYDGYDNVSYCLVSLSPVYSDCDEPTIVEVEDLIIESPSISVYPNPFNEFINFKTDSEQVISLRIFDMSGRLVIENDFQYETVIDGNDLIKGVYFFAAQSVKGNTVKGKVIKE